MKMRSGNSKRSYPISFGFKRLLAAAFDLLSWMTLHTLEHRDIAKIDRVRKWLVCLVAIFAFMVRECPEIDRVLKWPRVHIFLRWPCGVVDRRVADITVI